MGKLKRKLYERELEQLQIELVKLQEWVKYKGLKVVVIFEGRDAAGKGGVIKRITEKLNPASVELRLCLPQRKKRKLSGIFSVTSRISRPQAKSYCLIAVGTTVPGWKK